MYAIVKSGAQQFKVQKDETIKVSRLNKKPGDVVELDQVILLSDDNGVTLGNPIIEGVKVVAEVINEARGKKLIVFKMKRRKKYRRKNGHRQWFTELKVKDIITK